MRCLALILCLLGIAAALDFAWECAVDQGRSRNCNQLRNCCQLKCSRLSGQLEYRCQLNAYGRVTNAICNCYDQSLHRGNQIDNNINGDDDDDDDDDDLDESSSRTRFLADSSTSRACRSESDRCSSFKRCCELQCGTTAMKWQCRELQSGQLDGLSLCDCSDARQRVDTTGLSEGYPEALRQCWTRQTCSAFRICCHDACGSKGTTEYCSDYGYGISANCHCS